MTYTTITDVENYLRTTFSVSTTPTDTYVNSLIADVDSEIDALTGTTWTPTTNTEILDVNVATNKFLVSKYPLISLTSIEYNDYTNTNPAFNPNWIAFDNSRTIGDFIITDKTIQSRQGQEVKIVYQYGHASVPVDVKKLATLMVVKQIIASDDVANSGTQSLSIGSLSLTTNIGLNRMLNLDNSINALLKRVGKYKTVFKHQ